MLSNEEKERIRAEELFRQTSRLELEQKKKPRSTRERVWFFLNSAFGLWVLSTIAVGFISWSYTQWEQNRTKEQNKNEMIRKLDAEIASRVQNFAFRLDNASTIGDYTDTIRSLSNKPDPDEYIKPVEVLIPPDVVFPEFENRSLRALLFELVQLVPKTEKAEVSNALTAINDFPKLNSATHEVEKRDDSLTPAYQTEIKRAKQVIQDRFKLKRWSYS